MNCTIPEPLVYFLYFEKTTTVYLGYSGLIGYEISRFSTNIFLSVSTGLLQLTVSRPTTHLRRTIITASRPLQNAAARLVLNLGLCDDVTPALKQLHWLPVEHRIKYKLCTMHQIHTG